MPEAITLGARIRVERGKIAKRLRRGGCLPAVLYGHGIESTPVEIGTVDFEKVFRLAGENTLIRLVIMNDKGGDVRNVLIHEVAMDPIKERPLHVDFYQVRMDEAVRVAVPLEFVGESSAVKNDGGILVKALQELEIEALPDLIPEKIEVDVSKLVTFDDAIYVKDLKAPLNAKVLAEGDTPVASVQPPRSEEELMALEEKPVEAVEKVAVEVEEKKAERIATETATEEIPQATAKT